MKARLVLDGSLEELEAVARAARTIIGLKTEATTVAQALQPLIAEATEPELAVMTLIATNSLGEDGEGVERGRLQVEAGLNGVNDLQGILGPLGKRWAKIALHLPNPFKGQRASGGEVCYRLTPDDAVVVHDLVAKRRLGRGFLS